jgi:hypothetical protein
MKDWATYRFRMFVWGAIGSLGRFHIGGRQQSMAAFELAMLLLVKLNIDRSCKYKVAVDLLRRDIVLYRQHIGHLKVCDFGSSINAMLLRVIANLIIRVWF